MRKKNLKKPILCDHHLSASQYIDNEVKVIPGNLDAKNSTVEMTRSSKEQKLFNNLLKTTIGFISGKGFTSLTSKELIDRLRISEQYYPLFGQILDMLVKDQTLFFNQGRYSQRQLEKIEDAPTDILTGLMHLHARGFGFVKPNQPSPYLEDIFIPKHFTLNAVDGDTVEVLVNTDIVSEKGPEGKVLSILTRARSQVAGIITEIEHGIPYAYAPMLGASQKIIVQADSKQSLKAGDRIVMQVIEWGSKTVATRCKFASFLGHISDPSCDVSAAIEEYELRKTFPQFVQQEALKFSKQVPVSEIRKREDLRQLTCFTIDPDTAKDYDDAISLTKETNGHYHLGVHIADVSHYVPLGGVIDIEASLRCNSTYFPGFCLPMLPRELSDNLCSLKPNVNRLTASILMEFDASGELCNYRIIRSVIRSCKRFTYREAKAVLDGTKKSVHAEKLHLMVELCGRLKKKRYERGSIEFGMPELVIIVDENGIPTHTDYVVYDITHQLVEEFMLKANETVALHLSDKKKHLPYRVHDEPAEENMKDFSIVASVFGYDLSPIPTPKEIQKVFDEAMNTPYGEYLATSYIRRMRLAIYSADNIGHYGLSLTHYCHFTSPIRRYVDLVIHRILFDEEKTKEELERIADECSQHERTSAKAENSVVLLKKLRLLQTYQLQDPEREYKAIITRVKNFGIYFEILELMLEGFLHVSDLENDYFVFDEGSMTLTGKRHGQAYVSGNKIEVKLKDIDLIRAETKWLLVDSGSRKTPKKNTGIRDSRLKADFKPKSKKKPSKKAFKKSNAKHPKKSSH